MYWNIQIKMITTTIIIITIIIIIFIFWSQCSKLSYYAMIIEWMQKLSKTTKFSIHCNNKKIWVRALSLSLYPYLLPFFALNSTNSILNFFIYHGVLTTATAWVYREWGITLWFPASCNECPTWASLPYMANTDCLQVDRLCAGRREWVPTTMAACSRHMARHLATRA